MAKVEFYEDESTNKDWRWRVKADNGEIIGASTEGYSRLDHAENNLKSLPKYARDVDIKTAAEAPSPRPENARLPLEFYEDAKGEWRWRVTAANGQIVHASSEGFSAKEGARNNLEALVAAVAAYG